ncbi:hypothetical protein [Streptacidiphilus jiangxiensis]|uniref:Uncharacterized protein n=1 Tax=Streptacidiphilus jiangxiensis TaxID=235985 RepID=A0A1H7NR27_STRJI|nr:hypothetical protein [Streptacidiphilus jiangxiensis]SEL25485.1 hypothetical protein SAMN05414137_10719 [Streptacidiphilus jiangxiensis]
MRVHADGVTPAPRALLISQFRLRPDFHVELDRPVFVGAGDRLSFEQGTLVVTGPTGRQRFRAARESHWICR